MSRPARSISLPIILGALSVALSIAMLVGWIVVLLQNLSLSREVAQNRWLMVAGILSLSVIMSVLVLFSVFLVRETLEIRRQDSFIDSVTHELKSPLASLKLLLETMERPEVAQETRRELRQMMVDDVERLSVFIDDVLEASRLAHSWQGHPLSDVAVAAIVRQCIDNILRRYRLHPHSIQMHVDEHMHVISDRTALETVLKNLLDNAVKYSNDPAEVIVTASRQRNMLHLEVRDRGIGIPPEHLKRVFERFYRVPAESVRSRRGTGVGLFVVAALVRGLGGKMEAYSAGHNMGTTLRVWLPTGAVEVPRGS